MVSAQPVPCFLRMCGTCLQLEACTWISKSLLCVLSSILPPVIQRHFQPFGVFACTIWVFESLLSCSLHLRSCSWKPLFVRSCVLLVRFCFCNLFLRFGSVLLLLGTCLPAHKQKSRLVLTLFCSMTLTLCAILAGAAYKLLLRRFVGTGRCCGEGRQSLDVCGARFFLPGVNQITLLFDFA